MAESAPQAQPQTIANTLTLGFWNLKNKNLSSSVANLIEDHNLDLLAACECPAALPQTAISILGQKSIGFTQVALTGKRILMLSRKGSFQSDHLIAGAKTDHACFIRLKPKTVPLVLNICAVHLPSQMNKSIEQLSLEILDLKKDILTYEGRQHHNHTALIGDFNLNPFDQGLSNRKLLCGVMDQCVATRYAKDPSVFYNPMWSCFGDRTSDPSGTFYYSSQTNRDYFFYMFDQFMLRPSILPLLKNVSVRIIGQIGEESLLSHKKIPNKKQFSDHLPIVAQLTFKQVSPIVEPIP